MIYFSFIEGHHMREDPETMPICFLDSVFVNGIP